MHSVWVIGRREFLALIRAPIASVFVIVFLALGGVCAFYLGGFFERNQADLQPLFDYFPWIFLLLMPAISMRLWAEEYSSGSIELLLSFPVRTWQIVLAKFLAAWVVALLALVFCFPYWMLVSWLGNPDHGVIVSGFIASSLLAACYIAIGSAVSAASRNQISAFLLSVFFCLIVSIIGLPISVEVIGVGVPEQVLSWLASLSALSHFQSLSRGVFDFRDGLYFIATISLALTTTNYLVEANRDA